jgi:hypothetical protein
MDPDTIWLNSDGIFIQLRLVPAESGSVPLYEPVRPAYPPALAIPATTADSVIK